MSHALSALMAQTARAVAPDTDGQLLRRFVRTSDEAAFAELVRRLGPLVLGVCRRIVPDAHTAEDAFQAAFLVLARRAAAVRPAEAVRGWLYGVAVRCAQEARTVSARRRAREIPVPAVPDRPAKPVERANTDALRVLDEEVAQLPEHLRAAVVLCELEGLSRKEAAGRLGLPEGTLSSRLAKARKFLADRLRQRGLILPASGATVLAHVVVSPRLLARTSALASTSVAVPPAVAGLTSGVLRTMFLQRLTTAGFAAALLAVCALAATPDTPKPTPPVVRSEQVTPKAPPPALPKGPNVLLYWCDGKMVAISDFDGKKPIRRTVDGEPFHASGQLSPDGKTLAYLYAPSPELKLGEFQATTERPKLHIRPFNHEGPATDLDVQCELFVWSPDGTEIACSKINDNPGQQHKARSLIVHVKLKKKTELKLPEDHIITDWAPDGRLVTTSLRRAVASASTTDTTHDRPAGTASTTGSGSTEMQPRLHLMNRNGTEHKALAPNTNAMWGRISPDGTRLLCVLLTFKQETPEEKTKRQKAGKPEPQPVRELALLDIATGKFTKVQDVPPNGEIEDVGCVWAPDGRRIVYTWRQKHEIKREELSNKETESRLIVCDPDGKNAKRVTSHKVQGQRLPLLGINWR